MAPPPNPTPTQPASGSRASDDSSVPEAEEQGRRASPHVHPPLDANMQWMNEQRPADNAGFFHGAGTGIHATDPPTLVQGYGPWQWPEAAGAQGETPTLLMATPAPDELPSYSRRRDRIDEQRPADNAGFFHGSDIWASDPATLFHGYDSGSHMVAHGEEDGEGSGEPEMVLTYANPPGIVPPASSSSGPHGGAPVLDHAALPLRAPPPPPPQLMAAAPDTLTFNPTCEQLLTVYLRRHIEHEPLPADTAMFFHDADIYAEAPWTLVERYQPAPPPEAGLQSLWYFFTKLRKTVDSRPRRRLTIREVGDGGCLGTWDAWGISSPVGQSSGVNKGHMKVHYFKLQSPSPSGACWRMLELLLDDQRDKYDEKALSVISMADGKLPWRGSSRKRDSSGSGELHDQLASSSSAPVRRLRAPDPPAPIFISEDDYAESLNKILMPADAEEPQGETPMPFVLPGEPQGETPTPFVLPGPPRVVPVGFTPNPRRLASNPPSRKRDSSGEHPDEDSSAPAKRWRSMASIEKHLMSEEPDEEEDESRVQNWMESLPLVEPEAAAEAGEPLDHGSLMAALPPRAPPGADASGSLSMPARSSPPPEEEEPLDSCKRRSRGAASS